MTMMIIMRMKMMMIILESFLIHPLLISTQLGFTMVSTNFHLISNFKEDLLMTFQVILLQDLSKHRHLLLVEVAANGALTLIYQT